MGDLFKKNFKRLTGVRGEDPIADLEIVRVIDISGGGATTVALSGDLSGTSDASIVIALQGNPVATGVPASGEVLTWDGSEWVAGVPASGGASSLPVGGDLTGTTAMATVSALQGNAVATGVPVASGEVLTWDGSQWISEGAIASLSVGGDLSGTTDSATVDGLQGRSVLSTAPASGEALVWNGTAWEPAAVAAAGGAGAGAIDSSELITVTGTSGNITDSDTFVLVTNTSAVALTLLGSFTDGKIIYVKDAASAVDRNANPITITPAVGTIDLEANAEMINTNQSVPLVHISGAWYIF